MAQNKFLSVFATNARQKSPKIAPWGSILGVRKKMLLFRKVLKLLFSLRGKVKVHPNVKTLIFSICERELLLLSCSSYLYSFLYVFIFVT